MFATDDDASLRKKASLHRPLLLWVGVMVIVLTVRGGVCLILITLQTIVIN